MGSANNVPIRDPDLMEAVRTLIYRLPAGASLRAERNEAERTAKVVVVTREGETLYKAER